MAPPRRVFISFDQSDQAAALDLIDRLREASLERVAHLPDADAAVVLARDERLGNAADIEGIHFRSQESGFLVVPVILGGANAADWPRFLAERQVINLFEPDGHEFLIEVLTQQPLPALSSSVTEARRRALEHGDEPVNALAIAGAVASVHPDYGGNRLGRVYVGTDGPQRLVDDWLRDVRTLFSETAQPELHSRAVVLGLGLLDPTAREAYKDVGLEKALIAEFREPVESLLTPRGLALLTGREEPPPPPPPTPGSGTTESVEETVPTHADNPATVDELGREGIARVLAARIRDMRRQERGAFLVHLHAPWGMGKTSLLNFLRKELGPDSDDPWIAIEFNAWRHQRIAPPWWWLMSALYAEGRTQLWAIDKLRAFRFVAREWVWRLWIGWPRFLILVTVLLGAAAVWWFGWIDDLWARDTESSTLTGIVLAITAIVAPIVTLWAVVRGAGRWLLTASPRGARAFVDQTRDPMATVQEHFADLVRWLGRPVIILVDDLDRCRGDKVVELLEGIQTLFRDQPVAYVVAADRDWLSDSYQAEYGEFVSANDEPGRPLGYLFLEKTFQLSVTLPPPPPVVHKAYWGRLLRPGQAAVDRGELVQARAVADEAFAGLETEAAIRAELGRDPGATPAEQLARREAAAIQLASPAVVEEVHHALEPFAPLLDSNPRAMKRLVNAYGMARGIETLGGENLEGGAAAQQTTALWTILGLRWPRLADYLCANPAAVGAIGQAPPEGAPAELTPLFVDSDVVAVVRGEGKGIEVSLDEPAVRRCGGQVQV